MSFLTGRKGKMKEVSTLTRQQQPLLNSLTSSVMGPGAGGGFGAAADYYRDLLSDNSYNFNAFAAPEMRQFNEQIIPDLAEQFAGMGSGALTGSGFRNAAVNAGASLSERLAAMRSGLRQQAAQGLTGLGQMGLGTYKENVYRPGSEGFLGGVANGLGQGAAAYFASGGNPLAAAKGVTDGIQTSSAPRNTSPYGYQKTQLPNFMGR